MRVRMLTTAAGPEGVLMAGEVVDVPVQVATALLAGGYAVPVEPPQLAGAERAVVTPVTEKRAGPKGK